MSKAPTLFDFDDLFPGAEGGETPAAKEKAVKSAPKRQKADPVTAETKIKHPESEAESAQETDLPGEQPLAATESRMEEQYVKPMPQLPGKAALEEALNQDVSVDLDKQLKEELAASRYPFDPASVEVIEREEKPAGEREFSQEVEQPDEPVEATNPLPEWNLDKNYYTIGEVAHLFGVNISHIRFWTTEFKMKPRTTRKGDRLYTPGQIAELRLIYHLVKEKKHTLKGAMEILKSRKGTVASHLDLRESLIQLRDMLAEIRAGL